MTLEKLLIFGFAIAACIALASMGTKMVQDRDPDRAGYKDKVTTLIQKTK